MNRKIYQNKLKTTINLLLLILIIVGLTVYMLVFNNDPITDISSLAILGFMMYAVYSSIGLLIKIRKTDPVIVFSDFAMQVSRKFKDESFLWSEIEDWRILHHADSTEIALTIAGRQKFIEISDLKTTTSEISDILETMLPGKEFIST